MAVLGLREARLANARVEAEIADDLRSESKRRMPPDRRRERRRSVHVHAREPSSAAGWQASAAPARLARARGGDLIEEVDLAQTGRDRESLVLGQLHTVEPATASAAEEIPWPPGAEVTRQSRPRSSRGVRARSSRSRRSTSRPSALVSSSGLHTSSRKSEASSLARVRASRLSVLALARRPIGACGCWHHHASDVRLDHPRDIRRADRRTRAPGPPHPGSARTAQAPAVSSRPSPPSATSPPSAIAPRSGRGGCLPPVKRTCPPLVGDRSKGAADEATTAGYVLAAHPRGRP